MRILLFLFPVFLFGARIDCPETSLIDQPIQIRVVELEDKPLTLELFLGDDRSDEWSSSATYLPEGGVVDLSIHSSIEGDYSGVDPMGLFWSMQSKMNRDHPSIKGDQVDLFLRAYVENELACEKKLTRVICSPQVEEIQVDEGGLVGSLFLPIGCENVPVVITLSGSNGGVSRKRAALLASRGIPAFALGYFRTEGLPQELCEIPLEYFERAFDWVRSHPRLNGEISLYGISRGGELALLLGSLFPDQIANIVAVVPSSVVYGALSDPERSAWTYLGEPILPNAPVPKVPLKLGSGDSSKKPLSTSAFLAGGKMNARGWESSRIPVEKIQARLFLIGARDDQMWPSSMYVKEIKERSNPEKTSWKIYKKAGHGIGVPYLPASPLYYHPIVDLWFLLGGTPKDNDHASRDSWEKIIEFLNVNMVFEENGS